MDTHAHTDRSEAPSAPPTAHPSRPPSTGPSLPPTHAPTRVPTLHAWKVKLISQKKPAYQITTTHGGKASRAVDGNPNGRWAARSASPHAPSLCTCSATCEHARRSGASDTRACRRSCIPACGHARTHMRTHTRANICRTCTHTKKQRNPWWKVKLGRDYYIDRVRIYNRQDCCSSRLSRVKVSP